MGTMALPEILNEDNGLPWDSKGGQWHPLRFSMGTMSPPEILKGENGTPWETQVGIAPFLIEGIFL